MDWSRWRWVIETRALGWSEDAEGSSRPKGGSRPHIAYRLVLFNLLSASETVGYGKRSRSDVFHTMKAWRQKRSSSTVKGLTLYVRYRFLTENTSTLSKKASWSVHKSAMIGTLEHVGLHSFSSLTAKKRKTSRGRQLLESRRLNNFSHAHHKNTKYSPRLCSYAGWCEQLYKTVFEENEVVEGSTSVFPTYMDNESRSYNTPRLYARLTWIHPNFDDFDATLRLPMCKQAALLQWGFMFDMVGLVEKNNKKKKKIQTAL